MLVMLVVEAETAIVVDDTLVVVVLVSVDVVEVTDVVVEV